MAIKNLYGLHDPSDKLVSHGPDEAKLWHDLVDKRHSTKSKNLSDQQRRTVIVNLMQSGYTMYEYKRAE